MLRIWYIAEDGKKRKYYPDIYIISEQKIVEVKSIWTYKKELGRNLLKEKACLKAGYDFKFMIF